MFRVKKVLNHNTLIGIGMDDNREYLLIGKGIGFGRKISERIEVSENVLYTPCMSRPSGELRQNW